MITPYTEGNEPVTNNRKLMRGRRKPVVIVGFSKKKPDQIKHFSCPIHSCRMVQMPGEDCMRCPLCGMAFRETEILSDTKIASRFAVTSNSKKIVSVKSRRTKNKKYFDQLGNEINTANKDIMQDIASGRTIIEYREKIPDNNIVTAFGQVIDNVWLRSHILWSSSQHRIQASLYPLGVVIWCLQNIVSTHWYSIGSVDHLS